MAAFITNRIRNVYRRAKKFLLGPIVLKKKYGQLSDLVIFDDIFPHPMSDWRINEFLFYLRNFKSVSIFTGNIKNGEIFIPNDYFSHLEEFFKTSEIDFSTHSIGPLRRNSNINAKLAYVLFYHNLHRFFPYLEKNQIPFAFTLYPGGQSPIFNSTVKDNLIKFTSSPLFRHVFVNMPHVFEYVIEDLKIDPKKVSFHFSGPIEISDQRIEIKEVRYWNNPLMICFAAHKYMQNGLNKGFDVFCSVARRFEGSQNIRFTVIGDYSGSDNIHNDASNISYLGAVHPKEFEKIFKEMHIIVSPVRSHVLHPGNFDGFPTGAALNAVMNGCVLISTDPHDNAEKLGLKNGIDLFLTSDRPSEIVQVITRLFEDRKLLYRIANNGYSSFFELTQFEKHKKEKFKILKGFIEE